MADIVYLSMDELMKKIKKSRSWIIENKVGLGAIGKRNYTFIESIVDEFLREEALRRKSEQVQKDTIAQHLNHDIRQTIARAHNVAAIGGGQILGRGGKARA